MSKTASILRDNITQYTSRIDTGLGLGDKDVANTVRIDGIEFRDGSFNMRFEY